MEKNISSLNNSNSHNNTNFMKFLIPSLLGLLLFIIPLPYGQIINLDGLSPINIGIGFLSELIKISLSDLDVDIRKYNLYLFIIFSILFDDTSLFDEEAKKENIITNSLYLNLLNCDSHLLISLINETNSYEKLITKIEETLKNINITEEDLERKKRVLISNELFSFENIEVINEMLVDSIVFENKIEEIFLNVFIKTFFKGISGAKTALLLWQDRHCTGLTSKN